MCGQRTEIVWEENTGNIPAGWKIGLRTSDKRRVFQSAEGSVLVGRVAALEHMNRGGYSEGNMQAMMDLLINKLPTISLQDMYPEVILVDAEADTDESSEKELEVLDVTEDVNERAVDPPGQTSIKGINDQTCRTSSRKAKYCQHCEKTFKSSSNLKAHIKSIHTGVAIPCPYCDKSYKNTSNMRAHLKTVHDGEKFPCNFCTKIFIQKRGLVKHKATMHSDLDISRRSGRQTIA